MNTTSSLKIKGLLSVSIVAAVLILDQIIKYLVKTSMTLHESRKIADWFYIYFTENKGMAFGWDFIGTLFLSSFRIFAVALLIFYIVRSIRVDKPYGFIICLSLIVAGASGNIIDNAFYGMIFDESTEFTVSSIVPFGKGYGSFLSGHVVDMFYFPIIRTTWPDWMPIVGGNNFVFFSPIFNFADASISCGGISLLIFYRSMLSLNHKEAEAKADEVGETTELENDDKPKE